MPTGTISKAFIELGHFIDQVLSDTDYHKTINTSLNHEDVLQFHDLVENVHAYNPWFIPEFVKTSLRSIRQMLDEEELHQWLNKYSIPQQKEKPKKIGVVMAGNIPLVGFHDFMCVLLSGHALQVKTSSKDEKLITFLTSVLTRIEPSLSDKIEFTGILKNFDAVIATGSDNSARYFDYYFGKYPNIIRKNRTSAAVLNGKEEMPELEKIADDTLLYFGLGCRNVSKLFLPAGYDPTRLFSAFEKYSYLANHHKFMNNHDYNRSVYLVNSIPHLDNGFIIMKEDEELFSPLSVVFYEFYKNRSHLIEKLKTNHELLQCIVSTGKLDGLPSVLPGRAQFPGPGEYADNVDTMKFLLSL